MNYMVVDKNNKILAQSCDFIVARDMMRRFVTSHAIVDENGIIYSCKSLVGRAQQHNKEIRKKDPSLY